MLAVEAQRFFESKRAGAVLKHAILAGYLVPFASKTGSASIGNRVVIVDGYAGAGRYDTGEPGSPALIAAAARRLQGRSVECFFVEKDETMFDRLRQLLEDEEGQGVAWEAWCGTVEENLSELLRRAEGVPLFLFLDPFGLGLPLDVILSVFAGRPAGPYVPATEILFRLDAGAIRRIRGALHAKDYPARAAQIAALDRAAGGTWWRDDENRSMSNEQYVEWFMEELLGRVCRAAHCAGWIIDVRHRPEHQPAYYLMFLTRHRDGMDVFAEALSSAQEKWRRAVFDEATEALQAGGQELLFDPEILFEQDEEQLASEWRDQLERNVRGLLTAQESFVVRDRMTEVYGSALGIARSKHLRQALKKLHKEGVTVSDSRGDLYAKRIVRGPTEA